MVDRERLEKFISRFGLPADSEQLRRLRTRVVQAAKETLAPLLDKERDAIEREFAFRNGSEFILGTPWGGGLDIRHGITDELEDAKTLAALVERTQHLLWSFESLGYFKDRPRYSERDGAGLIFAGMLRQRIDLSPGVDLRVQQDGERIELAPAGVPILDDVADRVTQWLSRYPDTQKEFRQTQTILAEKRRPQYRQAQDSLRFALEKLLKLLLKNSNRLEDQGKPPKEWLHARRCSRESERRRGPDPRYHY